MDIRADLYSFCGTSREACGLGCNPNWGDCWGQDPLLPTDSPYDIYINGKIEGVQCGLTAAVGGTNIGLEPAVGVENFSAEHLALNNDLFGLADVTRLEDGLIG